IATASQAIAFEQALGSDGIRYDAARFNWIGRAAQSVEVTFTWHTSPSRSIEDARGRETVMGATSPASPTVIYLKALNTLARTRFKIVPGFAGVPEAELAMQRGEVEGSTKSWLAMKGENADWLRDNKVNLLVQYAMERTSDLPHVPLLADFGQDANARAAL